MKWITTFLLCLSFCDFMSAQQGPADIDKIPLPPGFLKYEGDQPLRNDAYREELSGYFENPEKAGKFKSFALKTTAIKVFMASGHPVNPEKEAYDFYMEKLGAANVSSNPDEQMKTEPDISRLNRGETTKVLFYPSWAGGGIFKWFYNNGDIKMMTVTIGTPLMLAERTFVEELPVVVPEEAEMGFPLYPGAEFRPLQSVWSKGPGGFGARKMVFHTADSLSQIQAFFEKELGQKGTVSSSGTAVTFTGSMPDPETYQFSTLTLNRERLSGTGTWYSCIEYYYPYP